MSLGALVDQSVDWATLTADDLVRALARSTSPARDLRRFYAAVTSWRASSNSDNEARRRYRWLEVAEEFLRKLGENGISRVAGDLSDLDERLAFLADTLNRDVGRFLIAKAIDEASSLLARDVPRSRPDDASANDWTRRLLLLVDLGGSTLRAEMLSHILGPTPEWLLEAFLLALGRLQAYDNYHRELAFALALTANEGAQRVLARLGSRPRTPRQDEILRVLGRHSAEGSRGPHPSGSLSPEAARDFLHRVQANAEPDAREALAALLDSHRSYDREVGNVLADYLAQVPSNHEDVIDFLTRFGTRQRARALASWGGPSVTISQQGSMRMSSVARGGPLDADQPSPDFDVGRVLARIPAEAAVELVRKQVDPQFSAHYLSLLTKRPDFGAIAARIAADRGCIARWQYAKREYAGPIWRLLERPAWGAREIESLRWQLFPALLPRFETRALQHLLYRSPQRYHGLIRANLLERLATSTVEELGALFAAADMLDDDALRDDLVRALDPTPLAQIPADADARSAWLRGLSRLFRLERAVAETIVCAIEPAAIADLVSDPMFRDLELHRATAGERLAFKARLVRAWAADDPPACEAQLLSTAQTDFDLLHAAGLDTEPLGHDPHRPEPLCAGDEWLDSVAVAVPGLVEAYAVGMLRTGSSDDAKDVAFSLRTLGHSIVRWLNRQKLSTPDVVWDVAQARMVDAARTGDLKTASTIAALELPGDAARLRSFREECVAVFAAAMKGAPVIDYRGPLKELLDVLERDAPDLATALTRGAPP